MAVHGVDGRSGAWAPGDPPSDRVVDVHRGLDSRGRPMRACW